MGAECRLGAVIAHFGQIAEHRVGIVDQRRHQFRRLVHGIAEHDALIVALLILVGTCINTLCDMGRLIITDILDTIACYLVNAADVVLEF